MIVMFDRLVSAGGWVHSIDERDVATEFPLCSVDFDNEVSSISFCAFFFTKLLELIPRIVYNRTPSKAARRTCPPADA